MTKNNQFSISNCSAWAGYSAVSHQRELNLRFAGVELVRWAPRARKRGRAVPLEEPGQDVEGPLLTLPPGKLRPLVLIHLQGILEGSNTQTW